MLFVKIDGVFFSTHKAQQYINSYIKELFLILHLHRIAINFKDKII